MKKANHTPIQWDYRVAINAGIPHARIYAQDEPVATPPDIVIEKRHNNHTARMNRHLQTRHTIRKELHTAPLGREIWAVESRRRVLRPTLTCQMKNTFLCLGSLPGGDEEMI